MSKKIVVISFGYPNVATPTSCTFLKELVIQWRSMGKEVIVINPLTFTKYLKCTRVQKGDEHFPLYFSYMLFKAFPFLKKLGYKLSDLSFLKAVERVLRKMDTEDIILYSHFLNAGYIAAKLAKKMSCHAYCAFGESDLWSISGKNEEDLRKNLNSLDGFISVSSENSEVLISKEYTNPEKILYAPNGVELTGFGNKDKNECRKKLGFSINDKIGIFVGHFIDRKGPLRVQEAVKDIQGLKMIYIGSGEQTPSGDNILYCGKVSHQEIDTYLCSADFFILPTKAEGCCNAIIEAIACGLPVISSIGRFNDDILHPDYSIRVNPEDIKGLKNASESLIEDEIRLKEMSVKAKEASKAFDLSVRAQKIIDFIK